MGFEAVHILVRTKNGCNNSFDALVPLNSCLCKLQGDKHAVTKQEFDRRLLPVLEWRACCCREGALKITPWVVLRDKFATYLLNNARSIPA